MKPQCYDRAAYKKTRIVQDGWQWVDVQAKQGLQKIKTPYLVQIDDQMSKNCQQWGEYGEARTKSWNCEGCKWR